MALHSIFAVKYWVASRKVAQLTGSQKKDPNATLKERIVLYLLLGWSILSMADVGWLYWSPAKNIKWFDSVQWRAALICSAPPVIMMLLLISTFVTMKSAGHDGHVISQTQVILQLSA